MVLSIYLLHGATSRERNWLIMIKMFTNTNSLTQRKSTSSFTLAATVFVMISLIVLRAPLVLLWLHNTWTPFYAWTNISLHEFSLELLDAFQSARCIFSWGCPVLFPKNPKILSYKRCLDYTAKHLRWLSQFYKSKPNIHTKEPIQNTHQKPHFLHHEDVLLYLK